MKRVKRRIFSGQMCEQVVYAVRDNTVIKDSRPRRPRFKDEAERARHRTEMSRRRHLRSFQANFGPQSLYSTMTFSQEYEIHTFEEAHQVARNYCRRLLYACPEATIFLYMGRGRATQRIHFHLVTNNIPEQTLKEKWGYGGINRIAHLREHNYVSGIDHGQDYAGLANYLFDHWTPEVGGHRWKAVGKVQKPDPEAPTECKRDYTTDKPPRPPKGYMLVDVQQTPYGYLYCKYMRIPQPKKRKRKGAGG